MDEVPLQGGNATGGVVRVGETVRKPWTPTTAAVHEFIGFVAGAGVDVPAVIGRDDKGRQVLEFVSGQLAMELPALSLDELKRVGELVRAIHDGSEGFAPVEAAEWDPLIPAPGPDAPLVCHNDLAPWNLIVGDRWVFIDWDGAGPSTRLWDLAYSAQAFALGDLTMELDAAAARLAAFVDGYDAALELRERLPGAMTQRTFAMYELLRTSHRVGREPWGSMHINGHGRYWHDATRYLEQHADTWSKVLLSADRLPRVGSAQPAYDTIGLGYRPVRRPDPRIGQRIEAALGDASTVINVGAGAGSYEPTDRWVLAIEPSAVMIAQRPQAAAPVIQASAEDILLADKTVDAAMAVLTVQHWPDLEAGLDQLIRVTRERIVIVTMDVAVLARLWILDDYLPDLVSWHAARFPSIKRLSALLPNATAEVLAVPHDCTDRFLAALWARPYELLEPAIRAGTSPWHDLPAGMVDRALARLQNDLADGSWHERHGRLLERAELDVGLRLVTSKLEV